MVLGRTLGGELVHAGDDLGADLADGVVVLALGALVDGRAGLVQERGDLVAVVVGQLAGVLDGPLDDLLGGDGQLVDAALKLCLLYTSRCV